MANIKDLGPVVERLLLAFQASEQKKAERDAANTAALAAKDAEIAALNAQLAAVQTPTPVVALDPEAQAILDNALIALEAKASELEAIV